MGELVRYLQGLTKGIPIDEDILAVLKTPYHMPCYIDTSTSEWKFSQVAGHKYNFIYVPWVPNCICYGYVSADRDFISRPFSGCYMAIYVNEKNERCGTHISKGGGGDPSPDTWNRYSPGLVNCTLFKPDPDFALRYRNDNPEVWGIIADSGKCYTVVVNSELPVRFLGIKEEDPLSGRMIPM